MGGINTNTSSYVNAQGDTVYKSEKKGGLLFGLLGGVNESSTKVDYGSDGTIDAGSENKHSHGPLGLFSNNSSNNFDHGRPQPPAAQPPAAQPGPGVPSFGPGGCRPPVRRRPRPCGPRPFPRHCGPRPFPGPCGPHGGVSIQAGVGPMGGGVSINASGGCGGGLSVGLFGAGAFAGVWGRMM